MELLPLLKNIPGEFDLNVNLVDEADQPKVEHLIRALCPRAFIKVSENRGLGCRGFQQLAKSLELANVTYEKVLFIHTKKATNRPEQVGMQWRAQMVEPLMKDPVAIATCLSLLETYGAVCANGFLYDDFHQ